MYFWVLLLTLCKDQKAEPYVHSHITLHSLCIPGSVRYVTEIFSHLWNKYAHDAGLSIESAFNWLFCVSSHFTANPWKSFFWDCWTNTDFTEIKLRLLNRTEIKIKLRPKEYSLMFEFYQWITALTDSCWTAIHVFQIWGRERKTVFHPKYSHVKRKVYTNLCVLGNTKYNTVILFFLSHSAVRGITDLLHHPVSAKL